MQEEMLKRLEEIRKDNIIKLEVIGPYGKPTQLTVQRRKEVTDLLDIIDLILTNGDK